MASTSHAQLYDAFGEYVRSQRQLARLTLRQTAELASISNPYLSQIEHGLVLPSIAVLGALADALSVSAETMLLRAAGIASPNTSAHSGHTEDSIRQDPRLDSSQKHALLAVLASFLASPAHEAPAVSMPAAPVPAERGRARARPNSPTSRSARPASAGGASSDRQKGV
jgi:transcriptional regulator with XRE-family HTH domain